jgi:Histidine kinase
LSSPLALRDDRRPPPMTAASTLASSPGPAAPRGVDWRALLPMAALLATALTIYQSGFMVLRWPGTITVVSALAFTWATQFGVSMATLGLVAALYPHWHGSGPPRPGRLALLIVVCALAATSVQGLAMLLRVGFEQATLPHLVFMLWSLSLATLIVLAHHFGERSRHAASVLHDAELGRLGLERELASARAQLLQAQVEPHFIFNALANARRLMRTDAEAARTMLADLLRYLEEALPRLRDDVSTLGREAELVRAYLAVHQVRMGPRLRFEVDVPAGLAERAMPPMLLLTLVENALKHGLRPMVEGGTVSVRAHARAGRIEINVADTGHGMGSGSGHGTGLANVRARLKAMYGAAASLTLALNEPRGVVATITLPITPQDSAP